MDLGVERFPNGRLRELWGQPENIVLNQKKTTKSRRLCLQLVLSNLYQPFNELGEAVIAFRILKDFFERTTWWSPPWTNGCPAGLWPT